MDGDLDVTHPMASDAIHHRVGKRRKPVEAGIRGIGHGVVPVEHRRAVVRLRHLAHRQLIVIEIEVVGQDVDHDGLHPDGGRGVQHGGRVIVDGPDCDEGGGLIGGAGGIANDVGKRRLPVKIGPWDEPNLGGGRREGDAVLPNHHLLNGQGIAIEIRVVFQHAKDHHPVLIGDVEIIIGRRWDVVGRHQHRDRSGGGVAQAVGHCVVKGILAVKTAVGRVGDSSIAVVHGGAIGGIVDRADAQGIVVGLLVIVEHGNDDRHPREGRGPVIPGDRHIRRRIDRHRHVGVAEPAVPIGHDVGEGIDSEEVLVGRVCNGVVAVDHRLAIRGHPHVHDSDRISIGIGVIGQHVDRDLAIFVDNGDIIDSLRRLTGALHHHLEPAVAEDGVGADVAGLARHGFEPHIQIIGRKTHIFREQQGRGARNRGGRERGAGSGRRAPGGAGRVVGAHKIGLEAAIVGRPVAGEEFDDRHGVVPASEIDGADGERSVGHGGIDHRGFGHHVLEAAVPTDDRHVHVLGHGSAEVLDPQTVLVGAARVGVGRRRKAEPLARILGAGLGALAARDRGEAAVGVVAHDVEVEIGDGVAVLIPVEIQDRPAG